MQDLYSADYHQPSRRTRPLWKYRLHEALLWAAIAGLVVCVCWLAQAVATL